MKNNRGLFITSIIVLSISTMFYSLGGIQALIAILIPLILLSIIFSNTKGNLMHYQFHKEIKKAGFIHTNPEDKNEDYTIIINKTSVELTMPKKDGIETTIKNQRTEIDYGLSINENLDETTYTLFIQLQLPLQHLTTITEKPSIGHFSDLLPIQELTRKLCVRTQEETKIKKILTKKVIKELNDFQKKFHKKYHRTLQIGYPIFTLSQKGIGFHRIATKNNSKTIKTYAEELVKLTKIIGTKK